MRRHPTALKERLLDQGQLKGGPSERIPLAHRLAIIYAMPAVLTRLAGWLEIFAPVMAADATRPVLAGL